ncbi:MAG: ankyrin repeat domain-containing protein, partial [Lentisphaeria bacterium]|nr:ankyrin repeat domain-containing protein [Lentisphaeria bacterium]
MKTKTLSGRIFPVLRIFSALCALFLLSSCAGDAEKERAFRQEMNLLAKDISSGNMTNFRRTLTPAHASARMPDGVPLLHLAAANGRKEALELLLAKGADPSARDPRGSTALHVAAGNDHAEIVELLLKKGVSVDASGYYGRTALLEAARCGS